MSNHRKQAKSKGKTTKRVVSFETDKELADAIRDRAGQFERSVSSYLRKLVKDDLKEREAA